MLEKVKTITIVSCVGYDGASEQITVDLSKCVDNQTICSEFINTVEDICNGKTEMNLPGDCSYAIALNDKIVFLAKQDTDMFCQELRNLPYLAYQLGGSSYHRELKTVPKETLPVFEF